MKRYILISVFSFLVCLIVSGCVSQKIRFPSSVDEIYSYKDLKQNLVMAAQNNILFYISDETLSAAEKKEVDSQCRTEESPFWTEKLSAYLNIFRQHPEWLQKFHVLEIKKADHENVSLQKDLDGASILSIQYVRSESRGQITYKTNLPCSQNKLPEYLGKELVHTQFEFPQINLITSELEKAPFKNSVQRFNFDNRFITYLAERGFILKYNHALSFNRTGPNNDYVLVNLLNKYSEEISQNSGRFSERFSNDDKSNDQYVSLWMKILNKFNQKENIVQFFSFENKDDLRVGINFIRSNETRLSNYSQMNLFSSFKIKNNQLSFLTLQNLNECLSKVSTQKTYDFLRKPASEINFSKQNISDLECGN